MRVAWMLGQSFGASLGSARALLLWSVGCASILSPGSTEGWEKTLWSKCVLWMLKKSFTWAVALAGQGLYHHFFPSPSFANSVAVKASQLCPSHTDVHIHSSLCSWQKRGLKWMDMLIHKDCGKAPINRLWNSVTSKYCVLEAKLA